MGRSVYINGVGIVSALGIGVDSLISALREGRNGFAPLSLFGVRDEPLLVAQVKAGFGKQQKKELPRTHQLALQAAEQAMTGYSSVDAVVVATSTGGILRSEDLLKENRQDRKLYRYHGLDTVADVLAERFNCSGGSLTISTACSSSALAIAIAGRMVVEGRADRVLVGGADSLCRLTYFGFNSLQLVDKSGSRPLDKDRAGMTVGEGAAFLLLTAEKTTGSKVMLTGAGLSCDAWHPATPHPEGRGAFSAMEKALHEAGIKPGEIDYINLHGTGTRENDLAESKAVRRLFVDTPRVSSIKGATGHTLAAAGAIEAVLSAACIENGFIPANIGLHNPDPELALEPVQDSKSCELHHVLSNSFGFGGNNGSLVFSDIELGEQGSTAFVKPEQKDFAVHACSCISGAGATKETMDAFLAGDTVAGKLIDEIMVKPLSPAMVRRVCRLSRIGLRLAHDVCAGVAEQEKPNSVFMGTGWGSLSETHSFLQKLYQSDEQFPGPSDFIGSVHNAAGGQVALMLQAEGANVTTSGGDCSFEQAVMAADSLISGNEYSLVMAADEAHPILSPLFDHSVDEKKMSDGGGVLLVSRSHEKGGVRLRTPFYSLGVDKEKIHSLIDWCGGIDIIKKDNPCFMVGIPAAVFSEGEKQFALFKYLLGGDLNMIHYRGITGEFASSSALAAVMAFNLLQEKETKYCSWTGRKRRVIVLGFGGRLTAYELYLEF